MVLGCNHQFHASCVGPWLQKVASCPICRYDMVKQDKDISSGKSADIIESLDQK